MTLLMSFLVMPFPKISAVAFWIPLPWLPAIIWIPVKWYGLAYAAGLLLGWTYVKRLLTTSWLWPAGRPPFAPEKVDDLLLAITAGVVLGGRIGYVVGYKPAEYLANPSEIFKVWNGGMSFHGGFLGVVLAVAWFARRERASLWTVLDLAAAAVPIGLFFGRLANFINAELWGRPSSVAWAMVFPDPEAGPVPRHPSQLYEAGLEGLVLFVVCGWLVWRRDALKSPGLTAGCFTAGYGIARSICELFREPDPQHWATTSWFTAGILYSIPMILAGAWLIRHAMTHERKLEA